MNKSVPPVVRQLVTRLADGSRPSIDLIQENEAFTTFEVEITDIVAASPDELLWINERESLAIEKAGDELAYARIRYSNFEDHPVGDVTEVVYHPTANLDAIRAIFIDERAASDLRYIQNLNRLQAFAD